MDSLIYIFKAAGIVAWPLFASSIAAVAPIVERLAFWFRVNRRQRRVVRDVLQLYSQNPDSAIKKLQVNGDLPLARIFLEALEPTFRRCGWIFFISCEKWEPKSFSV